MGWLWEHMLQGNQESHLSCGAAAGCQRWLESSRYITLKKVELNSKSGDTILEAVMLRNLRLRAIT